MGVSFLYESAKDTLKWHKLSVKKYINIIMHIGNLYHLSDEDFTKFDTGKQLSNFVDLDVINDLAIAEQKAREKDLS